MGFSRFRISAGQAIGRAIDSCNTGVVVDHVGRIISASAAAGIAEIIGAQLAGIEILATA